MPAAASGQDEGAAPAAAAALERAIAPVGADRFFAAHWERAPLVVRRAQPGRFDDLLSLADVERLITASGLRTPAFRLVKRGERLRPGDYTRSIPWSDGAFTGVADVGRVAALYADGATIVLQGLHHHWAPAAAYCRALEARLGCPVQANAYLSPPAAQGFPVHHDTHDVFVLQVAGRKRWRVFAPVHELPLRDQPWSDEQAELGEPVHDLVLEPGDAVYLPRGWPHEALTSEQESLHLTVGAHPPTWIDAVRAALDACAGDVRFRRAVAADGRPPDGLLDRLAAELEPELVARRVRRRFVRGRPPLLEGQLEQARALATLTLETPLERRPTVIADLDDGPGGGATLLFEGREVRFPPQAAAPVRFAFEAGGRFTAAALPGRLDEPGRLVLARRLVREGFLRVVPAGAEPAA